MRSAPGGDRCDRDVARPQPNGDLFGCALGCGCALCLWRHRKAQGHVELGEGHRTNEALSISRYQEELVFSIRRWRYNVGQQQHGCRASSMERPQREKFGPSHGFDGEGVVSGRKDTLLPVHFVREGEASSGVLGGSQSRLNGEGTQSQNSGICEFAKRFHRVSCFRTKKHTATWSCMAWAWIDRENYGVSRFAMQRTWLDAKHRVRGTRCSAGFKLFPL